MADVKTTQYTANMDKSLAEEVDSLITNIAPTETPFLATIGKDGCDTTHPEWLEDTLGDAGENAQIESFDAEAKAITPPDRLENYTQIMAKSFAISGSLEAAKKHGRKSELNYQTGLKTKEIARDCEWAAINSTKNAGAAGTARKMDGAIAFADAGNSYNFGGTQAGTNHLTEDILTDILQNMWEQGADPDTVLAPPAQKRKISAFTQGGRLSINADASQKKITMAVRIVETDFGTVAVIPARYIEPDIDATPDPDVLYDKVLVYERAKMQLLTFRKLKREELAKTGDGTKLMLVTEKSLKCRSKKCVGVISNLTRVKV
jgi:uncharacterized protein YjhX (UPF0386 family)